MKKILLALILAGSGIIVLAQSGTIKGIVFDETKQPMPGANVYVKIGINKIGVATDINGSYTIKPLPSGSYDLFISFLGFDTVRYTSVSVHPEKITFVDNTYLKLISVSVKGVAEVIGYREKLIDPDGIRLAVKSAVIDKMADKKDISGILRSISTDFKVSSNGNDIYFRGSRSDASAFYVDGIRVESLKGSIPSNSIGSFNVYSGGVPAKFGDFTGGVVVIETKSYFEAINEWQSKMRQRSDLEEGH